MPVYKYRMGIIHKSNNDRKALDFYIHFTDGEMEEVFRDLYYGYGSTSTMDHAIDNKLRERPGWTFTGLLESADDIDYNTIPDLDGDAYIREIELNFGPYD